MPLDADLPNNRCKQCHETRTFAERLVTKKTHSPDPERTF
jgi:hypothetical protein